MAKLTPVETLQFLNEEVRAGRLDPLIFLQENFLLEGSNFLIKKPIHFEPWQTENVLRPVFERVQRELDTFLIGLAKKSGKSTLAAVIAFYALLLDDLFPEVYSAAGDKDQARVIFGYTKKAFERSPMLRPFVKFYADAIERVDGNGVYRALASDASGTHGLNPSCVIWDELWNQPSYDLWEALTISPARANPFHFIVTYAGYQARSGNLLWDLYSRGLSATDPRMYMFWRSGPDANLASWVTPQYLASQRLRLPEHIYRRLHENSWTVAEGSKAFRIPSEVWSGAFEDYIPGNPGGHCYAMGVDLGKHRDHSAYSIIRTDVKPLRLVAFQRLPLNLDYTRQVEFLSALAARFDHPNVRVDKGAAGTAVIEQMRAAGMHVTEVSFTNENKSDMVAALQIAFEQVKLLLPRSGRTLEKNRAVQDLEAELFNFEPSVLPSGRIRYAAGGSFHDDMVMSLCLAYAGASQVKRVPFMPFVMTIPNNLPPRPRRSRYQDLGSLGPYEFGPESWWRRQ